MTTIDKNTLDFATALADEAGKIVQQYFRKPFTIEKKGDETPVTIADRTVEKALRKLIEKERPDDGILGEEFGPKDSKNGCTWVLDPIDGTKSFIAGRPTFGTLIALAYDNVPVLGLIDQPIIKDRWVGATGHETTHNGNVCQTRTCSDLSCAVMATTDPIGQFAQGHEKDVMETLRDISPFQAYGMDCYSYGLLSSGHVDLVIETLLQPYDFAALVPIVTGAGGYMKDWSGQELTLDSNGHVLALGNPALLDKLEFLKN